MRTARGHIIAGVFPSLAALGLFASGVAWAGAPTGAGPDPLESVRAELRAGRHESAIDGFTRLLTTGEPTRERRLAALEGRCEAQTRLSLAKKRPEAAARAIEDCSAALHLESGVARLWRLRGLARLAAGQPEQALINFNHALRLEPADAVALRHRGLVQLGLGRHAEADADFQRAARLDPDQAWHAFNRGLLAARSGKIPEAVEAWRAFEQARGPAGREWLAFVARREGGDADARRVVEAMQRADGNRDASKNEPAPEPAKKAEIPPEPAKKAEIPPEPAKKAEIPPEPAKKAEIPPEPAKKAEIPPEPAKKAEIPPEPAKKESASMAGKGGRYEFRLGSFLDRGNLESTLRALNGAGLAVREEEVMVGEMRFFRLTAGPFVTEEEAKTAQEKAAKVPGVRPEPVRVMR
ncbi:hypothetical protein SIID45300_00127 [Candidatus Magnetaquicoccaceae bacterium FCR-1]|uniref:SPOR domain-containing protein n=1 Tax=Candidatus Magnetaquiglobus chichijimensis TaxID=3141448 RepID=A0ABQ0C4M2_9PROT